MPRERWRVGCEAGVARTWRRPIFRAVEDKASEDIGNEPPRHVASVEVAWQRQAAVPELAGSICVRGVLLYFRKELAAR